METPSPVASIGDVLSLNPCSEVGDFGLLGYEKEISRVQGHSVSRQLMEVARPEETVQALVLRGGWVCG